MRNPNLASAGEQSRGPLTEGRGCERTRAARYFGRYLGTGCGARRFKAADHELHAMSCRVPPTPPAFNLFWAWEPNFKKTKQKFIANLRFS